MYQFKPEAYVTYTETNALKRINSGTHMSRQILEGFFDGFRSQNIMMVEAQPDLWKWFYHLHTYTRDDLRALFVQARDIWGRLYCLEQCLVWLSARKQPKAPAKRGPVSPGADRPLPGDVQRQGGVDQDPADGDRHAEVPGLDAADAQI